MFRIFQDCLSNTLQYQNVKLHKYKTSCVNLLEMRFRVLTFLVVFAKLRKATVGSVMSVCLSIRTEQLGFP